MRIEPLKLALKKSRPEMEMFFRVGNSTHFSQSKILGDQSWRQETPFPGQVSVESPPFPLGTKCFLNKKKGAWKT